MRILILDEAERDLEEGRQFYEAQREGLGAYFLDTLFSDIDSLQLYACFPNVSPSRFTTPVPRTPCSFMPCSIADAARRGFGKGWNEPGSARRWDGRSNLAAQIRLFHPLAFRRGGLVCWLGNRRGRFQCGRED